MPIQIRLWILFCVFMGQKRKRETLGYAVCKNASPFLTASDLQRWYILIGSLELRRPLSIGSLRNRAAGRLRKGEWRKKCGARLYIPNLESYAISFRHSAVLSVPAVLLRELPNEELQVVQVQRRIRLLFPEKHKNKHNNNDFISI